VCSQVNSNTAYYKSATLVSGGEIQCTLPLSPISLTSNSPQYLWSVSISNNNITFSTAVQYLVYDSVCMNCASDSLTCQQLVSNISIIVNWISYETFFYLHVSFDMDLFSIICQSVINIVCQICPLLGVIYTDVNVRPVLRKACKSKYGIVQMNCFALLREGGQQTALQTSR
jgi:hypothetical protein